MHDQKKIGVVLSYIALTLNIVTSIVFIPFFISSLGDAEYGLYRIVQSFAAQLSVMVFGIGSLITVMVAKFNAKEGNEREKENFIAMGLGIATLLATLVMAVGLILFLGIDSLFQKSMTQEQILLAKSFT